ncbi:DNA gyrase subunit A [Candidatus Woesearchaeota archaeon]|nr:DNA gyrase subunit A [Candidatus Woesearchaeota archaeon]
MANGTQPSPQNRIVPRIIEDEMKQSYLAYSMSVIVGRALPDVRDGLKPVHRRVLFSMHELGLAHNKAFRKSAKIVGEVMGNYHPHGDTAIYDTMVRMAQAFSLRYPFVNGQGNFGSVDGDNAAAMRYTEARLAAIAEEMLADIEKETVSMVPNYDGSRKEPSVLPSKVPNLLVNGSAGIAVGMATNIPPHNLREVSDAIMHLIQHPDADVTALLQFVHGPDFPTGGIILGRAGIKDAYKTGRGKLTIRAKAQLEETKTRQKLIITEIPYQVNKSELVEEIADLVRDKKVQGISDLRDESDRDGMRIVIELKTGANSDVVLNQLYAHSRMQTTFGIIQLALVGNQPKVLNLKEIAQHFIDHRRDIVRKRTAFDLREAEHKSHVLAGLIIALDDIDNAIALIKQSKSAEAARIGLVGRYKLSEIQAQAILDMKLQKLTSLEQDKIREEQKELLTLITDLKDILAKEPRILHIITQELEELKKKYGDERRTQIIEAEMNAIEEEELIKPEDMVVTVTHAGYVKRLTVDTYKEQRRGGKGIIATGTKEEDFVEDLFIANTRSSILFFTNKGKVHWIKVYQLPEASRQAKGTAIVNLLQLEDGEKVHTFIPIAEFDPKKCLFFVTQKGTVKKTSLEEFSNPRRGGIIALGIEPDDALISVLLTDSKQDVIIATENGMAIRFKEDDVRSMGRTAYGVIGIKLRDDKVVSAVVADETKMLLSITEKGYGKRTPVSEYRLIGRGGVGVINFNITDKTGKVVAVKSVVPGDGLMLISKNGIIIRTKTDQISEIGRNTQGVRVMRLDDGDEVMSAALIVEEENGNGQ